MRRTCALLFCAILISGCSDDDKPPPDSGPGDGLSEGIVGDGSDGGGDTGPLEHNIGQACSGPQDCKPGSPMCVIGVCSVSCIADDPTTPLNEDSCPENDKHACSTITVDNVDVDYCLLRCTPSDTANPCPSGSDTSCQPDSVYYTWGLKVAVCWDSPCTTNKDCPVLLETKCTDDTPCDTTAGQYCSTVYERCALEGVCNTASGICGAHTRGKAGAAIGDPCKTDLDCANDQFCERESTDTTTGKVTARNGYCTKLGCTFADTLTSAACPAGSGCNRAYFGGQCQKVCSVSDAASCRGVTEDFLGDYECYHWENLVDIYNVAYSDGPLCDYAPLTTCDFLAPDMECKDLGDSTNSSDMKCRDPKTDAALTNVHDPAGYCLDNSASGPLAP